MSLTASNGVAEWPIERLNLGWCFRRKEISDDTHYPPYGSCPGPHGELYVALVEEEA